MAYHVCDSTRPFPVSGLLRRWAPYDNLSPPAQFHMAKPRVFIGSSVEGLNIAYAVQQNLLHDAEVTVWDQGVFELSRTTLESLNRVLTDSDFGVFVFSPDDLIQIRNSSSPAVRDNVLFEFGLFIGRLSRERVYFLLPMGGELHLPTDLLGITPGRYETERADGSMQAATGGVCHQIRTQIRSLGMVPGRNAVQSSGDTEIINAEEKRTWFQDFFESKFEAAKDTLEAELTGQSGADALVSKGWVLLCEMRIRNDGNTQPLIDFAAQHADSARIQSVIATILRLERYPNKAIEILVAAQEKFPNDASIAQMIARCHHDVEDKNGAIAALERFGPDNFPTIAIDLAETLEKEERVADALVVIQRCHANHPSDKQLRLKYARLAQELEKHAVAAALLHGLTIDDPKSIEYWGNLGNSCLQLDLADVALHAYRRAQELMSEGQGSQWIVANIGNLLTHKGLPTEACSYLERALKFEPQSEYAHSRMAGALKKKAAEQKQFEKVCSDGKRQVREAQLQFINAANNPSTPATGLLGFASAPNTTSVDASQPKC